MNTNFEVIGLTRLGIKLESTPETDALTTRPPELRQIFHDGANTNKLATEQNVNTEQCKTFGPCSNYAHES